MAHNNILGPPITIPPFRKVTYVREPSLQDRDADKTRANPNRKQSYAEFIRSLSFEELLRREKLRGGKEIPFALLEHVNAQTHMLANNANQEEASWVDSFLPTLPSVSTLEPAPILVSVTTSAPLQTVTTPTSTSASVRGTHVSTAGAITHTNAHNSRRDAPTPTRQECQETQLPQQAHRYALPTQITIGRPSRSTRSHHSTMSQDCVQNVVGNDRQPLSETIWPGRVESREQRVHEIPPIQHSTQITHTQRMVRGSNEHQLRQSAMNAAESSSRGPTPHNLCGLSEPLTQGCATTVESRRTTQSPHHGGPDGGTADEDGPHQEAKATATKRKPYIRSRMACPRCAKRKRRCDMDTPCKKCLSAGITDAQSCRPTFPSEPISSEPISAGPISAEPIPAEPIPAEPIPAEPIPAEPIPSEPISAGSISAEPTSIGSISAEPISAEPTSIGSISGDPISAEPTSTGSISAEPISSEPVTRTSDRKRQPKNHKHFGSLRQYASQRPVCLQPSPSTTDLVSLRRVMETQFASQTAQWAQQIVDHREATRHMLEELTHSFMNEIRALKNELNEKLDRIAVKSATTRPRSTPPIRRSTRSVTKQTTRRSPSTSMVATTNNNMNQSFVSKSGSGKRKRAAHSEMGEYRTDLRRSERIRTKQASVSE